MWSHQSHKIDHNNRETKPLIIAISASRQRILFLKHVMERSGERAMILNSLLTEVSDIY